MNDADNAMRIHLDALVNAMEAMGMRSVLSPVTTTREGVLVVAGSLFAELVGAASNAQYNAESAESIRDGEVAFTQGWSTTFETVNSLQASSGTGNPVSPRTQVALLATFLTLAADIADSYNPDDTPDPLLTAAAAALAAGADLLVLATLDRNPGSGDADTVHSYMHEIHDQLARAEKAFFYGMTHTGHYAEEEE